jgi:hypothetical protein
MRPVAAGLACVVTLILAAVGLQLIANRLDWTLYALVHDLRWAAFALSVPLFLWSALASVSSAVWRAGLPLGRLLDPLPWPRVPHRVWVALLVLAGIAVLIPVVFRPSPRGVSLRVGQAWPPVAAEVPARGASRFAFHGAAPPRPERPLSVVMAGWTYAPVSGPYHFELTANWDALVEVDDYPLVGLGSHGATIETPWATDPSGARRTVIQLRAGFHRVRLLYRQPAELAHVALRWVAPYQTRAMPIPPRYLLPDETSSETLRWRARALGGQRLGMVVLVSLLVLRLVGIVRRLGGVVEPGLACWAGRRPAGRMVPLGPRTGPRTGLMSPVLRAAPMDASSTTRLPKLDWLRHWAWLMLAVAVGFAAYVIGPGLAWSDAFIAWPPRYPAAIPVGDHLQTAYYLWLWRHALETLSHLPWVDPFQFTVVAPATRQPFGWPMVLVSVPVDLFSGPVAAYNAMVLTGFVGSALAAAGWLFALTRSRAAAVVGGTAFALTPFRVIQAASHVNAILSPLVPLSLWLAERALRGPERGARRAAWGSVVALLSLVGSGELHLALYGCGIWGAYVLQRADEARSRALSLVVPGAVAVIGAGVLAAAQHHWILAPSIAAHGRSWEESAAYAPRLRDVLVRDISWPELEHYSYPGAAILALAVFGIARARLDRRLVIFCCVVVASAYALALIPGLEMPALARAYQKVPLLGYSRVPGRILILAGAGLAVLAGLGVASLSARTRGWVAAAAVIAITVDIPRGVFAANPAPDLLPGFPAGVRTLHLPPFDSSSYSGAVYGFLATYHPGPMTGGYSPFVTPEARDAQRATQPLAALPPDPCKWKSAASSLRLDFIVVHGPLFGPSPLQWPGNGADVAAALGALRGFESTFERDGIWVYRVHPEQMECPG